MQESVGDICRRSMNSIIANIYTIAFNLVMLLVNQFSKQAILSVIEKIPPAVLKLLEIFHIYIGKIFSSCKKKEKEEKVEQEQKKEQEHQEQQEQQERRESDYLIEAKNFNTNLERKIVVLQQLKDGTNEEKELLSNIKSNYDLFNETLSLN